jgi:hypothetical protein
MTYQNDPKTNRPINRRTGWDNNSYTGWIIGGVAVVAVILGVFMWTGRTNTSNTAANTDANRPHATAPAAPAQTAPPSTTGSAVPPAPAPR